MDELRQGSKVDRKASDCQASIFLVSIRSDAYEIFNTMAFTQEDHMEHARRPHGTLNWRKFNKPNKLPTTDIKKLTTHLAKDTIRILDKISEGINTEQHYHELQRVTLARLLVFNKIQTEAVSYPPLKAYSEWKDWRRDGIQEVHESTSTTEQELYQRMDIVEIQSNAIRKTAAYVYRLRHSSFGSVYFLIFSRVTSFSVRFPSKNNRDLFLFFTVRLNWNCYRVTFLLTLTRNWSHHQILEDAYTFFLPVHCYKKWSYGCVNSEPKDMPSDERDASLRAQQDALKIMYQQGESVWIPEEIEAHMKCILCPPQKGYKWIYADHWTYLALALPVS